MIKREIKSRVEIALGRQAAVALLGPRQVGKTTLAKEIAQSRPSIYLDLESSRDRAKLDDPLLYLEQNVDKLVILDEIHRVPEIFQELRGVIDERRQSGFRMGQFLILGSASMDLLKQSSESLAGRIEYVDLSPLNLLETSQTDGNLMRLWLRGGFPDSLLAQSDGDSLAFRESFIKTYLEREIPLFHPNIPRETLGRLWVMLAHTQGSLLNNSKLGASLSTSAPTVSRYVDLLVDLMLVRRLLPYHPNVGKRLIKSPRTYIRDSGILHALLTIETLDDLLSHPINGISWEGFVIENILSCLSSRTKASFYRTAAGAEIDLILDFGPQKGVWAVEIKKGHSPKIERSFRNALEDIKPKKAFIVYSGEEMYPKSETVDVLSLSDIMKEVKE